MKWILYVLLAPSLVLVLPEVAMGECNDWSIDPMLIDARYSPAGTLEWELQLYKNGLPAPNGVQLYVDLNIPNSKICNCNFHQALVTMYDASGQFPGNVTTSLRGGGCVDASFFGLPIFFPANWIAFYVYDTDCSQPIEILPNFPGGYPSFGKSSDVMDASGRMLGETGWDPNNVCTVGLGDAVFHRLTIKNNGYEFCSDLDNSGPGDNLQDAVLLTPDLKHGPICARQN